MDINISKGNAGQQISAICPSKLRSPDITDVLHRERLYKNIDDSKNMSLIVIYADPGYGKTTLITAYLMNRKRKAIWYHFSTTDRIPGTFISHICYAIFESFPEAAQGANEFNPLAVIDDPEMAGVMLALLLNRVNKEITLVFEEYCRVDENSDIHRVLMTMVEHLSPGVQIIILSRSKPPLPLSKLFMDQRVIVLTKKDLEFTAKETEALFSQIYNCPLNSEELCIVNRRLEGWAIGLRLTYKALKAVKKRNWTKFWLHFADSPELFDFLTEEVLSGLSQKIIIFLYKTSIFSVLEPEVLSKLLPEYDSSQILEMLIRKNLLTIKIDKYHDRYRYHDIFRQYLYRRLQKTEGAEAVRDLHAQAADIYNKQGKLDFAIGHYLSAGKYQFVLPLIQQLANQHRGDVLLGLIEGRLERSFPEMECMYGAALRRFIPMDVYKQLIPSLVEIADDASGNVDRIVRAYAQQRLGAYYYYLGDTNECIKWLGQSRETFFSSGLYIPASYSCTLMGLAYLFQGDPDKAEVCIKEALDFSGGDEGTHATMNALFAKAELALSKQSFSEAEEVSRMALNFSVPDPIGMPCYYSSLAVALLNQGNVEEAYDMCEKALVNAQKCNVTYELGFVYLRMAMLLRAKGQIEEAWVNTEKALELLEGYGFLFARALLLRAELAYLSQRSDLTRYLSEVKEFWQDHNYNINLMYESLVAPTLLSLPNYIKTLSSGNKKKKMPIDISSHASHGSSKPDTPASLCIQTLGKFKLFIQGQYSDPNSWGRDPSRRLLFLLILNRNKMLTKDQIIEALWPNSDPYSCNERLWVALHVLRKNLDPFSNIVSYEGRRYCLQLPQDSYLDLDQYLYFAEKGLAKKDREMMEKAAVLYRGDFLEEYIYDEFLDEERTRLSEMQKRIVMSLADLAYQDKDMDTALIWYRQLRLMDPFLEGPVIKIMKILIARGETAAAVEAYNLLFYNLQQELNIEPNNEVKRLYKQIAAGNTAYDARTLPKTSLMGAARILT